MTAWVVMNAGSWRSLPTNRQQEIRAWLQMNAISPLDVPADSTVVVTDDGGAWEIWHEQFVRGDSGMLMVDPGQPDEAYVRECAVPLQIDPPVHWLTEAV
jgi:hypothetical protein